MSTLKQLKCPSCGATLNQDFPNQLVVECPYCHQQVVNDIYQFSGKDSEPRALEFRMTENEVVEKMVNLLIGDNNVPTDIFDKMQINSIEKYYVPMYIFEGTYRAPWTARRERYEERQRRGYDGKIETYHEILYDYFNGEAVGNFSIDFIPSNVIARLNLSPILDKIIINHSQLSPFSNVKMNGKDDIEILEPSSGSDSVWRESGESIAREVGIGEAHSQAFPGEVTSCSASCELRNTLYIYIPLWIIRYKYNEELFSSVFYAEQYMNYSHPIVVKVEAHPTEEQQIKLKKYKVKLKNYNRKDNIIGAIQVRGSIIVLLYIALIIVTVFFDIDFLNLERYFWPVFLAGIGLWGVTWTTGIIIRIMDGIDDIEADIKNIETDIAYRTSILRTEADSYRQEKGRKFLNNLAEIQNLSNSGNSAATAFVNQTPLYDESPSKTKTCFRCSKQIDVHHMYCRYCGAKQN